MNEYDSGVLYDNIIRDLINRGEQSPDKPSASYAARCGFLHIL